MTQRNRKKRRPNKQHGYGLPGIMAAFFVFLTLGLTYVWMCSRCDLLGREMRALERENERIRNAMRQEESRWSGMRSAQGIEQALKRWNLDMQWPTSEQVVWISEQEAVPEAFAKNSIRKGASM